MYLKHFDGGQAEYDALRLYRGWPQLDLLFHCKFGKLTPDARGWQAGDIFLSTPLHRKVYHDWIVHKQIEAFPQNPDQTHWTHVAVMAEDGRIWDITPGKDVSSWTVGQFIRESECIGIRRLPNWDTRTQRNLLPVLRTTAGYAKYPNLPRIALAVARDMAGKPVNLPENVQYCSNYIDTMITRCLGMSVFKGETTYPASFALSPQFDWVDACWTRC